MGFSFLVRKWHRWLALIIGLQAVIWLISGVYMVTLDLDYIHGDQLVQKMDEPIKGDYSTLIPLREMQQKFPEATSINLISWLGNPHYRIYEMSTAHLVDARTGQFRSPLTEEDARKVAEYHFAQEGQVTDAKLLSVNDEAPTEIQTRPLPLWQISFNDPISTSFYISPNDGILVTRRHTYWRLFDFVWMLHIMDYENRSDMDNNLRTLFSLAGMWLLFYSFKRSKKTSIAEEKNL